MTAVSAVICAAATIRPGRLLASCREFATETARSSSAVSVRVARASRLVVGEKNAALTTPCRGLRDDRPSTTCGNGGNDCTAILRGGIYSRGLGSARQMFISELSLGSLLLTLNAWNGVVQRAFVITYLAWIFMFARRLRTLRDGTPLRMRGSVTRRATALTDAPSCRMRGSRSCERYAGARGRRQICGTGR
jgi:hypothetical protein